MDRHPRTAMADLLEELRLAIQRERNGLTDAQVLAVLAEVIRDVSGGAWNHLSRKE